MEMTTIQLRKLIAADGMVLTNGDIYGKEVYLGVNDTTDNWREITEAEYETIQQAQLAEYEIATSI